MAHRKDRKEALRREREEREAAARAAQQRKKLVGYGVGGALVVAALVVVVAMAAGGGGGGGGGVQGDGDTFPEGASIAEQKQFDVQKAASAAGCELKDYKGSGVLSHTTDPSQKVNYKQNPPTNGRHYEIPAEDGLYNANPPPDTALVHALEHGRVIVWAKPSLPQEAREQLRALFDEDNYQMLVVRRRDMPYAVAATAWNRDPAPGGTGRTLACDSWDDGVIDAIRSFRDEHRSNGPEPVP